MPRYYIRFLGGASKVHKLAGMVPSTYGTTSAGIGYIPGASAATLLYCQSCSDQLQGSPLLTQLNQGGDTVPGIEYFMLATKSDTVIVPYTNSWLKDSNPLVQNKLLQNYCATATTGHIDMASNSIAFTAVENFLSPPSTPITINCSS